MPSGYHHLLWRTMPDIRAEEKRTVRLGHCPQIGRDRDCLARDPAQRRRPRLQAQAGAKASARRGAASSVARKMTQRWRRWRTGRRAGPEQIAGRFRKEGIPWRAGSGSTSIPRRPEGRGAGPVPAAAGRRNWKGGRHSGGAVPDRTDNGAPGDRGGESGSAAGRRTRSSARATAARWRAGGPGVEIHASSEGWAEDGGRGRCRLLEMLLPLAALVHTITAATARSSRGTPGWRRRSGPGSSSRRRTIPGNGAGAHERPSARDPRTRTREDHRRAGEGGPGPAERASEEASMFRVKAGFGVFRRFPGIPVRVFHTLSTVLSASGDRPGRREPAGRRDATGPLIRSGPGGPPRDAARAGVSRRPRPSGPPTCAGRAAGRSGHDQPPHHRGTATLWCSLSTAGRTSPSCRIELAGPSPPCTGRPSAASVRRRRARALQGSDVAGEGRDADQGRGLAAADRAELAHPGDQGRRRDGADARDDINVAAPGAPPRLRPSPRSAGRTGGRRLISERTFGTGPSGSGSPTSRRPPELRALVDEPSRSTSMSRSRSIAASAGAVGGLAGTRRRRRPHPGSTLSSSPCRRRPSRSPGTGGD